MNQDIHTLLQASKRLFKPLFDRIVVQRARATQTAGGILLPESAVKNNEAVVVAVGQGRRLPDGSFAKPIVAEGDTVLLADTYNAHKITVESKDYEILHESDVLGVYAK